MRIRKVVNGKLYDTGTATEIAANPFVDSFSDCYETLNRKKNGEFFRVYINRDNTSCVIPVTLEEAQKICEDWLNGDDYMEIFGPVEE